MTMKGIRLSLLAVCHRSKSLDHGFAGKLTLSSVNGKLTLGSRIRIIYLFLSNGGLAE